MQNPSERLLDTILLILKIGWRLKIESLNELKGRGLMFCNEKEHAIYCWIESVGYGPKEGVSLRVTAPKFAGSTDLKIIKDDVGWLIQGEMQGKQTKERGFLFIP